MKNSRHIVTKSSDCGTFQKGDHLIFYDDGGIGCVEAQGWLDKEEVDTVVGMESAPDVELICRVKKRLRAQLQKLEG